MPEITGKPGPKRTPTVAERELEAMTQANVLLSQALDAARELFTVIKTTNDLGNTDEGKIDDFLAWVEVLEAAP
jgi:hypothetical protein